MAPLFAWSRDVKIQVYNDNVQLAYVMNVARTNDGAGT